MLNTDEVTICAWNVITPLVVYSSFYVGQDICGHEHIPTTTKRKCPHKAMAVCGWMGVVGVLHAVRGRTVQHDPFSYSHIHALVLFPVS